MKKRTIHQLMLKDTPYAPVLHQQPEWNYVEDGIVFCDAVDHVIREWSEGMEAFNTDGADEVAATIYSLLIGARLILYDLEQPKPEVNYIDALRHFDELRNAMAALVTSFKSTPSLSVWYSTLPFVIVKGYIRLRRQKREGC